MSKIEKALNRAQGERSLQLVPRSPRRSQQLVLQPPAAAPRSVQRASAAREIALIQEPQLRSRTALEQDRIIFPEMIDAGPVQAFRGIRTKLTQRSGGRNCSVVVTALDTNSGASFVALNLGVAFAFDAGKTALVMDCNRRDPSLHRLIPSKEQLGVTDYLDVPSIDVAQIIYPVGIPRLRVIPAGGNRDAPAEFFTSARMQELMQDIKERYSERYLIIDAPPMTQIADVQILSELSDHVILVVPYGKVTESQLTDAARTIGEQKLIGVVFNDEPRPPQGAWRNAMRRSVLGRFFGMFLPRTDSKS